MDKNFFDRIVPVYVMSQLIDYGGSGPGFESVISPRGKLRTGRVTVYTVKLRAERYINLILRKPLSEFRNIPYFPLLRYVLVLVVLSL